ncbi:MAG: class I SAM-dependent methyltransferase [Terracidiphilus sp.]|jgi:methyltransferase (TIGR00027 family)
MKNQSSLTAEYMALFRALESSRPATTRLFNDPFAHLFLHEWRKWFYKLARVSLGRMFVEMLLDRNAPGARAAGIARTKWIDDEAAQALALVPQLVLLGAGFDTRAYRLPAAQRVTTFELDHPETSRVKQAALRKKFGSLPSHVQFVEIDFNQQSMTDALHQAGFERTLPSCIIWEGVTNYLTAEAIDETLRQIAGTAPGSILLFTYIHRSVLDHPDQFFGAEKMMARLQSYGEPWIFGLHPDEIQEYLAKRGLHLIKDLSVAEVWQRAGRSNSGTRGYEFYRLASASVQN